MRSDREMKEAVEVLNNKRNVPWDKECIKARDVLIDLAQSYLSAEMPEEMYDPTKTCQPDYPDDYTKGKVYGFNEALRLCRLASLKDKMRVEELEKKVRERMDEIIEESQKVMALQVERARLEEALRKIGEISGKKNFTKTPFFDELQERVNSINDIAKSALANVKQGREGE